MKMDKTKVLTNITFVLLLVAVLLFGYTSLTLKFTKAPKQTEPANLDLYEFSSLVTEPDLTDTGLLFGVRDLKKNLAVLDNFSLNQKNQLVYRNQDKHWHNQTLEPIVLESPFKILINFSTQNTNSELLISGRLNLQNKEWWQDLIRISIGYSKETNKAYISVRDGQQEHSLKYFGLDKVKANESIILEFSDPYGTNMLIYDKDLELLASFESEDYRSSFPFGLFPERQLHLGINVSPKNGILLINKLLLYELGKNNE